MILLLSSGKRKRYRDDVLRCLAVPEGVEVQFRYTREIVEPSIWAEPKKCEGQVGLVCSINLESAVGACPLVPIRFVTIEHVRRHGTTMTVMFRGGKFAAVDDTEKFTKEVDDKSGSKVPRNVTDNNKAAATDGYFFFDSGTLGLATEVQTIDAWEGITEKLLFQPGYREEQFFWTVLGMRQLPISTDRAQRDVFTPWSEGVDPSRECSFLVYVFHPLRDSWDPRTGQLRLSSHPAVSSSYPLDQVVDSPYDLKEWRFRFERPTAVGRSRGWLRVGPAPGGQRDAVPEWEIDLPLDMSFNWLHFCAGSLVLGMLLAAPAIIAIWTKVDSPRTTIITSAFSLLFGVLAALVAALRIPRRV